MEAIHALRSAGCQRVYLDGSFVSFKALPVDFDACWDEQGVDLDALDPVLVTFAFRREAQRDRFGGELFPSRFPADEVGSRYLDFFQRTPDGTPKGIIAIQIGDLP
jgi:hypothetical protein